MYAVGAATSARVVMVMIIHVSLTIGVAVSIQKIGTGVVGR